jgi:hypothetical protein
LAHPQAAQVHLEESADVLGVVGGG